MGMESIRLARHWHALPADSSSGSDDPEGEDNDVKSALDLLLCESGVVCARLF